MINEFLCNVYFVAGTLEVESFNTRYNLLKSFFVLKVSLTIFIFDNIFGEKKI